MPVVFYRVAAWVAENAAVPVLEWMLSQAGKAVQAHEVKRAQKKGASSTGVEPTP